MANNRMGEHVNIAGIARFQLTVNKDGHVICAKAIDGNPIAASLLLESVAKWRFTRCTVSGTSKNFRGSLTVKFSIVEGRSAVEAVDEQDH